MAPALKRGDLPVWPRPCLISLCHLSPWEALPWLCGPGWGDGRLTPERSFCFQSSAHTVWGVFLHNLLWACVSYETDIIWLGCVGTFPILLSALDWLQVLSFPPDAILQMRIWSLEMEPKLTYPLGKLAQCLKSTVLLGVRKNGLISFKIRRKTYVKVNPASW